LLFLAKFFNTKITLFFFYAFVYFKVNAKYFCCQSDGINISIKKVIENKKDERELGNLNIDIIFKKSPFLS
jgi:hypothetical protein